MRVVRACRCSPARSHKVALCCQEQMAASLASLEARCQPSPRNASQTVLDLTSYWPRDVREFKLTLATWEAAATVDVLVISQPQLFAFGRSIGSLTRVTQVAVTSGSSHSGQLDEVTERELKNDVYEAACPLRYLALDAVCSIALCGIRVHATAVAPWRRALRTLQPKLQSFVLRGVEMEAAVLRDIFECFPMSPVLRMLALGTSGDRHTRHSLYTSFLEHLLRDNGTRFIITQLLGTTSEHVDAAISMIETGTVRKVEVRSTTTWRLLADRVLSGMARQEAPTNLCSLDLRQCSKLTVDDVAAIAAALATSSRIRSLKLPAGEAVSAPAEQLLCDMLCTNFVCSLQRVESAKSAGHSATAKATGGSADNALPLHRLKALLNLRSYMLVQDVRLAEAPQPVQPEDAGFIARLIALSPHLRSLDLSNVSLGKAGVQRVVEAMLARQASRGPASDLTDVVLSNTDLDDTGTHPHSCASWLGC